MEAYILSWRNECNVLSPRFCVKYVTFHTTVIADMSQRIWTNAYGLKFIVQEEWNEEKFVAMFKKCL
jgi:hypothetical protein